MLVEKNAVTKKKALCLIGLKELHEDWNTRLNQKVHNNNFDDFKEQLFKLMMEKNTHDERPIDILIGNISNPLALNEKNLVLWIEDWLTEVLDHKQL